jgi:hypothetical protein
MPLLQYFLGVGGALLCVMFMLNAYVPKDPPREQRDLDKSTIRITAPHTGDYVIDHFPSVRNDLAFDPAEAVRRALAMMPKDDEPKQRAATSRTEASSPSSSRKRHLAQRSQPRQPRGDIPPAARPQAWASNGWSNNSWSQNSPQNSSQSSWNGSSGGWSNNWNNNYSQNGSGNRGGSNRWNGW